MPQPVSPASRPITVHISTCARRSDRDKWGDTAYGEALARAIRSCGHQAELFFSGEAPRLTGMGDVVLRLTGPHLDDTVPGVPNLVWMISMPAYVSNRALARFQAIITSSAALCHQYEKAGLPAIYLPQATDPDQFHPRHRPEGAALLPIVFVGNHGIRAPRGLIKAVAALPGVELSVWGDGWEGEIPKHLIRDTHLPHDQLAGVYARSRIVLNSHMGHMAQLGMMSNRSYDALAAGAAVLSDRVQGFSAPDLPDLTQIDNFSTLAGWLDETLAAPPADLATRMRRNEEIRQNYSFDARARAVLAIAARALARGAVVPRLFAARKPRQVPPNPAPPVKLTMRDDGCPDNRHPPEDDFAALDAALAKGPVWLTMELSDPASMPATLNLSLAMLRSALAVRRILGVLARRAELAGLEVVRDPDGAGDALIHPMMQDLRQAQDLLERAPDMHLDSQAEALALRAQRLIDQLLGLDPTGPIMQPRRLTDAHLIDVMRNEPLYRNDGHDIDLDRQKTHIALWPRRKPTALDRPIGVFLHLYYAELAAVFAERLSRIEAPFSLYVSTDSETKAAHIASHLPTAQIRILPNRGRDIAPKFYGFADAYAAHDIILHLHGKRSTQSARLDGWMAHILDCLLPAPAEINRILSFFKDIDRIGLIAPQGYRPVLRSSHWGHNLDIAQELHHRLRLPAPLPDDERLSFPAGSMFWARKSALQPLLDLPLSVANFSPEARQIDGTLAHAIERMVGVVCQQTGFDLLRVAGSENRVFPKQKVSLSSNAALRDWLDAAAQTRRNEA